jgi:YrbI family 3-deoxy-D-manno-octulosonate 8-phosphate phosphatase
MHILAIIPARGGSKGIPRKNVLPLAGRPLIAHSIAQALASRQVTRVVVSTDDAEIAAAARVAGAEVVVRPAEISGDTAASESALLHVLDTLQAHEGYLPDLVVFLQATSPVRLPADIDGAIDTLLRERADSVFSACAEHFTGRWRRAADGTATPVNFAPGRRPRRQEYPVEYLENGSIYVFRPAVLRETGSRMGGRIALYPMPALRSLQIDEPGDFAVIEALLAVMPDGGGDTAAASARAGASDIAPTPTADAPLRAPCAAPPPAATQRHPPGLAQVRLLLLDFDGVLTDNRVWVDQDGHESVACSRADGYGIGRVRRAGIEVLVVSTEENPVVAARCRKLGIACRQGVHDKLPLVQGLARERGLGPEQIAYVGNDLNDLECLRWVGWPVAVADALPAALAAARLVTHSPGGAGAVREVCDWLVAHASQPQTKCGG